MSDGRWSGGTNNRTWTRPGSRHFRDPNDTERAHRLAAMLAGERFLCELCGRFHALAEHAECRDAS